MLVRIFKTNHPILGFALPLIAGALWLAPVFSEKQIIFSGVAMPFYMPLQFLYAYKILSATLSVLLIIAEAILLNFIVQQHYLLKNPSYLPALMYVALMCSIPEILFLHPVLFANLFLILTLKRCLDLSKNINTASVAFDSGFFISIASFFYFPSFVFLFFVWISLYAFHSFSLRESIVALTGFCVPCLFAGVYYYWFDGLQQFWSETIMAQFLNTVTVEAHYGKSFYAFIIFIGLMLLFSAPSFLSEISRNKASIRSSLRLIAWFAFFSVSSYFFASPGSLFHFCFAAIPLSIIFSNMFINIKPVFAELIFSLLIFLIVIYQLNFF